MLEPDQMQQYSYNILSYIAKVKHMAREEFESLCSTVATSLQMSAPLVSLVSLMCESCCGRPFNPSKGVIIAIYGLIYYRLLFKSVCVSGVAEI